MRRAFTLLEVLLVMAILVVVIALAWPSMESMYDGYRLRAAADQVRAAWQTARSEAMEKGRAYRFAVVAGQGNYRVAPDSNDYWNGGSPSDDGSEPPIVLEDVLGSGIRFSSRDNPQGSGSSEPEIPVGSVSPDSWMSTAVFLPNGTAEEDVEIILDMGRGRPLSIRLRAMTGAITTQYLDQEGQP